VPLDLLAGLLVVAALAILAFAGAQWASRGWRRDGLLVAMLVMAAGMVLFLKYGLNSLAVARALPAGAHAWLPTLGNASPVLAGALAGLAWNATRLRPPLRAGMAVALVGVALFHASVPVWARQPPTGVLREGYVVRQSTQSTCTPAAAATLLLVAGTGVEATEAEMARLCRTTWQGTGNWGLLRGLRLALRGTPWRAEPFRGGDLALIERFGQAGTPALLNVGLRPGQRADPAYADRLGRLPGVMHTVVVAGRDPATGLWLVADPSIGVERWSDDDLRTLWHGEGVRLVHEEVIGP